MWVSIIVPLYNNAILHKTVQAKSMFDIWLPGFSSSLIDVGSCFEKVTKEEVMVAAKMPIM